MMRIVPLLCLWILLAVAVAGCGPTADSLPPVAGNAAPAMQLPALDGEMLDLKSLRGQIVIVNFWATWCPPCVNETPRLANWHVQHAASGLAIVGVDTLYQDSRAEVEAFVKANGVAYPVLLDSDGTTTKRWDARQLPRSFVLDRDGVIRFVKIGELTDADFQAQIAPLLAALR